MYFTKYYFANLFCLGILSLAASERLSGQVMSGVLTHGQIPVAQAAQDIEDGVATESGGMINAPSGFTGASFLTQAVTPPSSNGQGTVTVQVKNSMNSMAATMPNYLACWDSSGAAATCLPSATPGWFTRSIPS